MWKGEWETMFFKTNKQTKSICFKWLPPAVYVVVFPAATRLKIKIQVRTEITCKEP